MEAPSIEFSNKLNIRFHVFFEECLLFPFEIVLIFDLSEIPPWNLIL